MRHRGYRQLMEPGEVVPFPSRGEVFLDQRGHARAMRIAWHQESDVVVLSLWQADRCTGTFRLAVNEVPRLVQALVDGLGALATSTRSPVTNKPQTAQLSPSHDGPASA